MSSPGVGLALASLTAWGLYGYLFSREQRPMGADAGDADPDTALGGTVRVAIAAGHLLADARAVHVRTLNGYVTLSGHASAAEAEAVTNLVRALPRVRGVRNRIETDASRSIARPTSCG